MILQKRMTRLFIAVVCAVMVTGCGSASTGRVSSDAVLKTAHSFAGPHQKIATDGLLVSDPDSKKVRVMWMFVVCKPGGGCKAIAPDGAAYPDLQTFVDDTRLLKPGATVSGNANIAAPGKPDREVQLTKHAASSQVGYLGGGVLLLALLVLIGWPIIRKRRRRQDEQGTLPASELHETSE